MQLAAMNASPSSRPNAHPRRWYVPVKTFTQKRNVRKNTAMMVQKYVAVMSLVPFGGHALLAWGNYTGMVLGMQAPSRIFLVINWRRLGRRTIGQAYTCCDDNGRTGMHGLFGPPFPPACKAVAYRPTAGQRPQGGGARFPTGISRRRSIQGGGILARTGALRGGVWPLR